MADTKQRLTVYEVEADGIVTERYSEAAAQKLAEEQRRLGKTVSVRPKPAS